MEEIHTEHRDDGIVHVDSEPAFREKCRERSRCGANWPKSSFAFPSIGMFAASCSGAGGNFSVGADISEFEKIRDDRHQSAAYEVAVDACSGAIAALGKPVVAAISGYCLGGGCHLALACDFRFGDRTAIVGVPAAKLSIVYGLR